MPTLPSLTYAGQLVASPYARELAAAEPLALPLMTEADFVSCKEFEIDAPQPVLLAYAQHYRLLEDLVVRALAQLPTLRHVLVRFHTVCLRPLPAGLVQPRVLLVDDPRRLAGELLAAGPGSGDILVIEDRLRRDTHERGDNTLALALYAASPDRARFAGLVAGSDFYRGTAAPDAPPVLAGATPPSPSMNYAHHYGTLVTDALEEISPLPRRLQADLHRAALGLVDSALIIEEPCTSFERKPAEIASTLQADERFTTGLDRIVAAVEADGLAPNYMALMREFATAMFSLFASPEQLAQVREWVAGGSMSSFLMTDAGGPSPGHWKTQVRAVDGRLILNVDKVWAMGGDAPLFAIVAAAVPNGIYPTAFLLSPQQCRDFRRTASGPALLEGVIRLQNVRGEVEVHNAQKLTRGGPTMLNRLLTIVRPQLVRCLMAHVKWLERAGRLALDEDARKGVETIQAIASHLAGQPYGNAAVTQVLATKFASNELLHRLVADGRVRDTADQRDLLAFTKMEGSSYRCLREIYAKAYAYNRPAAAQVLS